MHDRPFFLIASRALVTSVLLLVLPGAACSSNGSSSIRCTADAECANRSEILEPLGRCFPKEAYCEQGTCAASCREICEVVRSETNACSYDLICTASSSPNQEFGFCSTLAIECRDESDCPLYRPLAADATQAAWTCEGGFCSYPDFTW